MSYLGQEPDGVDPTVIASQAAPPPSGPQGERMNGAAKGAAAGESAGGIREAPPLPRATGRALARRPARRVATAKMPAAIDLLSRRHVILLFG